MIRAFLIAAWLLPMTAAADHRFALDDVQANIAIQGVGGWLLHDEGRRNPVAYELVGPGQTPAQEWFYFIPQTGEPKLIVHGADVAKFSGLPGGQVLYATHEELGSALKQVLQGVQIVAMEYAPNSGIPQLTRVDAETVKLVKRAGVSVESSAQLVQFAKSIWGRDGRIAHYIAAHHLGALRKLAIAHLARELRAGRTVSERKLQQFIVRGMRVRGLVGSAVVAAGVHTADSRHLNREGESSQIARGELVMITIWGRLEGAKRPVYANTTWLAYVGEQVPQHLNVQFAKLVAAREAAVSLIRERLKRRRSIRGFEVDEAARAALEQAGLAKHFTHRTGHSLDTSVQGDGTNLQSQGVRDTRNLVAGTGFTIEPGVYFPQRYGMRSEINVFIGPAGLEITTDVQQTITPVFPR